MRHFGAGRILRAVLSVRVSWGGAPGFTGDYAAKRELPRQGAEQCGGNSHGERVCRIWSRLLSVTYKNVALIESSFSYPDKGNRVKLFVLSAEDFITPYAPAFDSAEKQD